MLIELVPHNRRHRLRLQEFKVLDKFLSHPCEFILIQKIRDIAL